MQEVSLCLLILSTLSVAFVTELPPSSRVEKVQFLVGSKYDTGLYTMESSSAAEFEFPDDNNMPSFQNNDRSAASHDANGDDDDNEGQLVENYSSIQQERRKRRLQREEEARSRFVSGDDLHLLRRQVLGLRKRLSEAQRKGDSRLVRELKGTILKAQARDAEFVYTVMLDRMERAEIAGQTEEEVERLREEAMMARSALPQYNLEGLWVGKYGEQGYELINVTYVDNTLVAYKITSKRNVPKGDVSFTVDLGPKTTRQNKRLMSFDIGSLRDDNAPEEEDQHRVLEPIELGESAAEQWGIKYLQRFSGKGQVSDEQYINSQWMEGQLIIANEYFSFAWLPISQQVFFGRPSAELTLKLLQEAKERRSSKETKLRDHLERCVEETNLLDDEMEVSDGLFFSHDQQDYYNVQGCFE